MIAQPPGYVRRMREICDRHGALLVCDEVATGFGRTGTMFAVEQEGVVPDILTMAKGITGGYLPLAATVTTERVFESFLGPYVEKKTFFHGHTYAGNPLACAAATASMRLLREGRVIEGSAKIRRSRARAGEEDGARRQVLARAHGGHRARA
jgi:adenosylmethionine-8-amino-7-oxononanoate aminotransferase